MIKLVSGAGLQLRFQVISVGLFLDHRLYHIIKGLLNGIDDIVACSWCGVSLPYFTLFKTRYQLLEINANPGSKVTREFFYGREKRDAEGMT